MKIGLKANDIEILVSSFNEIGEEIAEVDIDPSNGIAPLLTISPDGIIDFEDLTFTQMWYWSSEHFTNIDTSNSNFILNDENQFVFGLINNSYSELNSYPIEVTYNNEMNLSGFELKLNMIWKILRFPHSRLTAIIWTFTTSYSSYKSIIRQVVHMQLVHGQKRRN